jgi:hypothetical protein
MASRQAQSLVFGLVFLGGFALWRTRLHYDPMDKSFEFEKSPGTRHMVPMHQRVDKEVLQRWLAEEEARQGAGGGGGGGGSEREGQHRGLLADKGDGSR